MKMEWIRMEQRIRTALRDYYDARNTNEDGIPPNGSAGACIDAIDIAIGEETGRGYESDFSASLFT